MTARLVTSDDRIVLIQTMKTLAKAVFGVATEDVETLRRECAGALS